jgi:hypothetical protein
MAALFVSIRLPTNQVPVEVLEADLADVAATMTSKLLVVKAVTEAAIVSIFD